jgi:hypothetical protein
MSFVAMVAIVAGLFALLLATRRFERREIAVVVASYAAHVASAFVQVWLHDVYYAVSDMHAYMVNGRHIARLLSYDFVRFAPDIVRLALHVETSLPFEILGEGTSTGTMSAVAGAICYFVEPTTLVANLVVGTFACFGQLALYKVGREVVEARDRGMLLVSTLLVPSVVFWSSVLAKEALVLGFFGILALAIFDALSGRRRVRGIIGAVLGAVGIAMLKPYVLFPFVVALAGWFYSVRRATGRRMSLPYLVAAGLLGVLGLAVMSRLFPEFGVGQLAQTAALQQRFGTEAEGGSFVEMGNPDAQSLGDQLPYLPLALLNSLFRPFLFEARSPPMLAASLETTALVVLVLLLIRRFKWRRVRDAVMDSPILVFSMVFVLSFGLAVGLACTNLGTLSRYRMPMMPFYAAFVLLLRARLGRSEERAELAPPERVPA